MGVKSLGKAYCLQTRGIRVPGPWALCFWGGQREGEGGGVCINHMEEEGHVVEVH